MERLEKVDAYIEKKSNWTETLNRLRDIIASAGLKESVKWGGPVYTIDGKNILGLGAFKNFVSLWFFQGALLADPNNVLVNAQEGKTKALRQWRFGASDNIPTTQVKLYIEEAINNHKKGLTIKPSKAVKKPLLLPDELSQVLANNIALNLKFESLNLSSKRELADFIQSAKRPETKARRLEKVVDLIERGKGLYDKYK